MLIVVAVGCMAGIHCVDRRKFMLRGGMLFSLGLVQGIMLGPLVNKAVAIDPGIVQVSFILTMGVFVSFTLVSMFTHRRMFLFLGGVLNTLLFMILMIGIFPSRFAYNLSLYGGLFLFMGYIVYDTQVMHRDIRTVLECVCE